MDKSVAWVKMVDSDQAKALAKSLAKVKDLTKGQANNIMDQTMDPEWDLASGKDLSKGPLEDSRES